MTTTIGVPRANDFTSVGELGGDESRHRRPQRGIGLTLGDRRDLGFRGRHARTRGGNFFGPRTRLQPRQRFSRGPLALTRGAQPGVGHSDTGCGIVALLARTGIGREQALEPREIVSPGP